MVNFITGWMD